MPDEIIESSNKKGFIWVIVILVILVAGYFAFNMFYNNKNNTPNNIANNDKNNTQKISANAVYEQTKIPLSTNQYAPTEIYWHDSIDITTNSKNGLWFVTLSSQDGNHVYGDSLRAENNKIALSMEKMFGAMNYYSYIGPTYTLSIATIDNSTNPEGVFFISFIDPASKDTREQPTEKITITAKADGKTLQNGALVSRNAKVELSINSPLPLTSIVITKSGSEDLVNEEFSDKRTKYAYTFYAEKANPGDTVFVYVHSDKAYEFFRIDVDKE